MLKAVVDYLLKMEVCGGYLQHRIYFTEKLFENT